MRVALLLVMALCLQQGCASEHNTNPLRLKLDDAVHRHALIDERIMEWGTPSGKDPLSDGRVVYTWKMPWSGRQLNPMNPGDPYNQAFAVQHLCTVVITAGSDNTVQSYNYRDC